MRVNLFAESFTQTPDPIVRSQALTPGAKVVYASMLSRTNVQSDGYRVSWVGNEILAKEAHCGERTVRRHVAELVDFGLIRIELELPRRLVIFTHSVDSEAYGRLQVTGHQNTDPDMGDRPSGHG